MMQPPEKLLNFFPFPIFTFKFRLPREFTLSLPK